MPRKPTQTPLDTQTILSNLPRISHAVIHGERDLREILPALDGPMQLLVRENLEATAQALAALDGLAAALRDQSDILALARRRPPDILQRVQPAGRIKASSPAPRRSAAERAAPAAPAQAPTLDVA